MAEVRRWFPSVPIQISVRCSQTDLSMVRRTFCSPAPVGYRFAWMLALSILASCSHRHHCFTPSDREGVQDSVVRLFADVAWDVSARGPSAWLGYFDDAPGFFMATNGRIALRDYPTARKFIQDTLVKIMPGIVLHWANLQVDPLSGRIAAARADYQETLTMADGKTITDVGYFTAIACLNSSGLETTQPPLVFKVAG